MFDELSLIARRHVENTMNNMRPVKEIAKALNKYIPQAADCTLLKTISRGAHEKNSSPGTVLSIDIWEVNPNKSGERAVSSQDFNYLAEKIANR